MSTINLYSFSEEEFQHEYFNNPRYSGLKKDFETLTKSMLMKEGKIDDANNEEHVEACAYLTALEESKKIFRNSSSIHSASEAIAKLNQEQYFRKPVSVTQSKEAQIQEQISNGTYKYKKRKITRILSACLGILGIHWFYLGYIGRGIISLIATDILAQTILIAASQYDPSTEDDIYTLLTAIGLFVVAYVVNLVFGLITKKDKNNVPLK